MGSGSGGMFPHCHLVVAGPAQGNSGTWWGTSTPVGPAGGAMGGGEGLLWGVSPGTGLARPLPSPQPRPFCLILHWDCHLGAVRKNSETEDPGPSCTWARRMQTLLLSKDNIPHERQPLQRCYSFGEASSLCPGAGSLASVPAGQGWLGQGVGRLGLCLHRHAKAPALSGWMCLLLRGCTATRPLSPGPDPVLGPGPRMAERRPGTELPCHFQTPLS